MQREIDLERFAYTPLGTFGRIWFAGIGPATIDFPAYIYTIERPWESNEPDRSCIPAGRYPIVRDTFRGRYPNFRLEDVPDRSNIEIHAANTALELRGCIAPGLQLGVVRHTWGVTNSRAAMDTLMAWMEGIERSHITITEECTPW